MTLRAGHLTIFADQETADKSHDVRRGIGDIVQKAAFRGSEVAVATLQDNMQQFLASVDAILGASPPEVGGLTLDEVQLHALIDSKGNIGIAGLTSGELRAQGGIKFVLRRKPEGAKGG